jgi:hypothetical protein
MKCVAISTATPRRLPSQRQDQVLLDIIELQRQHTTINSDGELQRGKKGRQNHTTEPS